MATRVSQHGYKYDPTWVVKAVLVHAWVVLITTGVLYQRRVSIQSLLHGCVLATTSAHQQRTHSWLLYEMVMLYYCLCWYSVSRAWNNLVHVKWWAWLTLDNAWPQIHGLNHSTASDVLDFKSQLLLVTLINHSCSHAWLDYRFL